MGGYLTTRFEFCHITICTRADAHSISHFTSSTANCLGPEAALEVLSRAAIALWRSELYMRKHERTAQDQQLVGTHIASSRENSAPQARNCIIEVWMSYSISGWSGRRGGR